MRDLFVTLREFLWTIVAVLGAGALAAAVIVPAQFADRSARVFEALQDEGFDIKIKTPIGEASFARVKQEIADSDAQALDLQRQLQAVTFDNIRLQNRVQNLVALAEDAGISIVQEEQMIEMADDGQDGDPQDGGDQRDAADPEPWVVIAGTQRSLDGQRVQLGLLRDAGIDNVVILQVDGWFQTAVIYDGGRAVAEDALARVSDVVGASRGAYVRALNRVCPDMTETPGDPDLWRCNG